MVYGHEKAPARYCIRGGDSGLSRYLIMIPLLLGILAVGRAWLRSVCN